MVEHGGMYQEKSSFFLPVITACGFASSIGQIIILRELLVIFYGNELAIGLIFACWLLWTALGSSVGGRYGARITPNASVLPTALVVLALLLPASVLWIRATRIIWAIPTGEMIGPFSMLLISLAGTGLFCVTSGALFGLSWTSLAAISENGSGQPLLIYLGEALGAATGGLFFYFVLLPRTSIFNATLLIGLIVLVLAAVLFGVQRCLSIKRPASPAVVLVAFALVAGLLISSADLDSKESPLAVGTKASDGPRHPLSKPGASCRRKSIQPICQRPAPVFGSRPPELRICSASRHAATPCPGEGAPHRRRCGRAPSGSAETSRHPSCGLCGTRPRSDRTGRGISAGLGDRVAPRPPCASLSCRRRQFLQNRRFPLRRGYHAAWRSR